MNISKLSVSIQSIVKGAYVPFVGIDEEKVISHVQKFFDANRIEIHGAIEIIRTK